MYGSSGTSISGNEPPVAIDQLRSAGDAGRDVIASLAAMRTPRVLSLDRAMSDALLLSSCPGGSVAPHVHPETAQIHPYGGCSACSHHLLSVLFQPYPQLGYPWHQTQRRNKGIVHRAAQGSWAGGQRDAAGS